MTKYKIEVEKELIIIKTEKGDFILDTGSQASFSLTNQEIEFEVNGEAYTLKYLPVSDRVRESLKHILPGKEIVALIGNDIIMKTNLTLDMHDAFIYFGLVKCGFDIKQYTVPLKTKLGLPYIDMEYHSKKLEMILDSGSQHWFVNEYYLGKECGSFSDYSPELGAISGGLYDFYDSIHEEEVSAAMLPKEYIRITYGIIPLWWFVGPGYCQFDFEHKKFTFTRRFI